MNDEQQTIQSLLRAVLREITGLAQKEMALFRLEVKDSLRAVIGGMVMMVGAAIFALAAMLVLVQALIAWLAVQLGSASLAALMVGVTLAVIAIAMGFMARSMLSAFSVAPHQTIASIQKDARTLSEGVLG